MTQTESQYIAQFLSAAKSWKQIKPFVRAGGVPGCRVPQGVTLVELAKWFYNLDELADATGSLVGLSPIGAIDHMRNEDQAYSPDW